MRERHAAFGAPRRRKERDRGPASAAEPPRRVYGDPASKTARRQYAVDNGAADKPNRLAQSGGKGCRKLHRLPSSERMSLRQELHSSAAAAKAGTHLSALTELISGPRL